MKYEDRFQQHRDNVRNSLEVRRQIKKRQEEMKKQKIKEVVSTIIGCSLIGGTATALVCNHEFIHISLPNISSIKELGPRLLDLGRDLLNDAVLLLEQALYYLLYGITIIVGLPTAVGLVAAFLSIFMGPTCGILDALCAPASLIIRPVDESYNNKENDLVEKRAKKIYDTFDHNHEKTLDNNATIIVSSETSGEINKLLRDQEKQRLLNELEALKQYKNENNKKLVLK